MAQVDPNARDIIPATDGFHDLKPVPDFFPQVLFSWYAIAAVCLILLLAAFLWARRSKKQEMFSALTMRDRTLRELEALAEQRSRGAITARDYAAAVSFTVRSFIESQLLIPATDRTSMELITILPKALERSTPLVDSARRAELVTTIRAALKECDVIAFGAGTEELAEGAASADTFTRIGSGAAAAVQEIDRMIAENAEAFRARAAGRCEDRAPSPGGALS